MANFLSSGAGGGVRSPGRQHPLLLWLDGVGYESSGPLSYWLSLAAYYLLLFACSWFVLQWFRRGRPWARARSFLSGKSKSEGDVSALGGGVGAGRGPPQLRYRGSEFNRRLLARTTVLRQPYVPSPWLGHRLGGHMQSFMFATWCPPRDRAMVSRLVSRQDQVKSSFDGGVFRMDWFDLSGTPLPADAPVVFVLPGVVGQGTNVYIRHLAAHVATKYGWRVVTKNWRGIGLGLSTRRPETWDHVALSDARDAIKHIRNTVGREVPMLGVGFSFGGCLLTAIAGSVPQEDHGLRGLVSISGLFDMSAMMKHIAEQYAYPYGFANTRVTVKNYRKFKVLETLTADTDVSGDGNGSSGGSGDGGRTKISCRDDGMVGVGPSSSSSLSPAAASLCSSTGLMRRRKMLRSAAAEATCAAAANNASTAALAPPSASFLPPTPTRSTSSSAGSSSADDAGEASGGLLDYGKAAPSIDSPAKAAAAAAVAVDAAAAVAQQGGNVVGADCSAMAAAAAASGGAGAGSEFVTPKQMAAMKDPSAFHEALTLPFTGDASVAAYFERIEGEMSRDVSSVTVPTLCLLAKDDPLCPPLAWVGALERAAKSDGIVVAITDHGGHCGWFDGLGAGSWLDRAAGDFLCSALEMSKERPPVSASEEHADTADTGRRVASRD